MYSAPDNLGGGKVVIKVAKKNAPLKKKAEINVFLRDCFLKVYKGLNARIIFV